MRTLSTIGVRSVEQTHVLASTSLVCAPYGPQGVQTRDIFEHLVPPRGNTVGPRTKHRRSAVPQSVCEAVVLFSLRDAHRGADSEANTQHSRRCLAVLELALPFLTTAASSLECAVSHGSG